jgi:glycosyltransferase involved in cell wall biosynthesis
MKSVCILLQNWYDFDARVRRKAEALISAGYSVDVLALAGPDGKKSYTLKGVNVRTLSLGKKRGSLVRYAFEYALFFVWCLFRLSLLMWRKRYDVIDINTLPDFLVFAAVPARWMGAKLVLDMHEITPEFYMSKYRLAENSWTIRILRYLEKISFDCADYVITIHEPILDLLVRRGLRPSKAIVIMNAADEARFESNSGLVDGMRGPDAFVMMYAGTINHIYGLDLAIEAFSVAHQEMPGAELWIIGSGSEEASLASLAKELGLTAKVRMIGSVASTEVPKWLRTCDVGILPIRRDVFLEYAFPNKLPELIISDKPVLMSRLKTIRHYFSDGALAYFEPNNPKDLANQMIRLHDDPRLRARLAVRAKEEYAPIRWEVMKERYLRLIDQAAGSTRAATQPARIPKMSAAER